GEVCIPLGGGLRTLSAGNPNQSQPFPARGASRPPCAQSRKLRTVYGLTPFCNDQTRAHSVGRTRFADSETNVIRTLRAVSEKQSRVAARFRSARGRCKWIFRFLANAFFFD